VLGHILVDPYVRRGKRAGAWVSSCVARRKRADGAIERPVAHLVCNFPAPAGDRPALLSHDDVRTLFHEMGHALHNVLSEVDHRAASGVRGVPWDGVEFPSQFHENWIWHPESLALISGHVDTGEPLPADLLGKLRGARSFCAASDLLRQAELSLVDLELHTGFDPARDDLRARIDAVRRRVAVVPAAPWDRFENSFLHIFTGAYAAGYYGYKWAEVLAADAFGRFEEEGLFAEQAARDFRGTVLARGGSEDFLDLFVRFRGRAPSPAALLRQAGIS
jgi:oligopeptidase A